MNHRTTSDPDAVFRALKPAALDGLTKDAYANHRDADLNRAFASDQTASGQTASGQTASDQTASDQTASDQTASDQTASDPAASDPAVVPARRPRRRPMLLVAGVAAAAAVATGGAVALTGHSGHTASTSHAPVASRPLDSRNLLLTAAETAARIPATTGRFWYTRERTEQSVPTKSGRIIHGRKVTMNKPLPFTAYQSWTEDSWLGSRPTDHSRTTTGIDAAVRFASPADEAKWKAMGSPPLKNGIQPVTSNYSFPGTFTVGGEQLSMKAMLRLPTTQEALEAELRKLYSGAVHDPKEPLGDTFAMTVWGTAQDLLSLPISSGTRSALFRILAEQPGTKVAGKMTDPEGRQGIAVEMPTGSFRSRMIIDPTTTRLLAYEAWDAGDTQTKLTLTYEATGWASALGSRP